MSYLLIWAALVAAGAYFGGVVLAPILGPMLDRVSHHDALLIALFCFGMVYIGSVLKERDRQ